MLDIVTEYAKRWRFCINPKKTKVLCFMETTQQAQQRKERFGESWICGGQEIAIAQSYVYLGVTMTDDLDFTTHKPGQTSVQAVPDVPHDTGTQEKRAA